MHRNKAARAIAVVAFLLALTACPESTLKTIAKSLNDYSVALNGVQVTIIQAHTQGLISTEETKPIVLLLVKLNQAGQQASALTRNLNSLPAPTAGQLTSILTPVIQSLQEAVSSGLLGIKNQQTRQNILAGLSTAQLALSTITALLPKPVAAIHYLKEAA